MGVSFPYMPLTHLLELSLRNVKCPRDLVPGHMSQDAASILNTCSKPLGKPLGLGGLRRPAGSSLPFTSR